MGIRFDDAAQTVMRGRRWARLQRKPFQVLRLLHRHHPHAVAVETMWADVYGDDPDGGPATDVFKIFIHRLRPAVMPLGIRVETLWGFGYRLTIEP